MIRHSVVYSTFYVHIYELERVSIIYLIDWTALTMHQLELLLALEDVLVEFREVQGTGKPQHLPIIAQPL